MKLMVTNNAEAAALLLQWPRGAEDAQSGYVRQWILAGLCETSHVIDSAAR